MSYPRPLLDPGSHLIHHMSSLRQVESEGPLILATGNGTSVFASDGTEYLDGVSGLINVNVGHGREELVVAATEAMRKLAYGPLFFNTATQSALDLADLLSTITPRGIERFFFAVGGSDANDSAVKIARMVHSFEGNPGKIKVLARLDSYHGMTVGAVSLTGTEAYRVGLGPMLEGVVHVGQPTNDVKMDIAELERSIMAEGPETIAALIAEPVSLPSGLRLPHPEYWPALQRLCQRHNIMLILDEVVTGFGRTGKMFAADHWGLQPDMMTMSKGITSGYLPLGALGVSERIYDTLKAQEGPFLHGFTTGGHPTSCAVAITNIGIILDENLAEAAARAGDYFREQLQSLCDRCEIAIGARNLGLLVALDLQAPKGFKAPGGVSLSQYVRDEMFRRRVIGRFYGPSTLLWGPALIISNEEIDQIVASAESVLRCIEVGVS